MNVGRLRGRMHGPIAPCPALGRWVSVASRFVRGSCLSGAKETEVRPGRLPRGYELALTSTDTTLRDRWTRASCHDLPGGAG
jgi:hypothetical protein